MFFSLIAQRYSQLLRSRTVPACECQKCIFLKNHRPRTKPKTDQTNNKIQHETALRLKCFRFFLFCYEFPAQLEESFISTFNVTSCFVIIGSRMHSDRSMRPCPLSVYCKKRKRTPEVKLLVRRDLRNLHCKLGYL